MKDEGTDVKYGKYFFEKVYLLEIVNFKWNKVQLNENGSWFIVHSSNLSYGLLMFCYISAG